jgi:hypothetical protein
MFKHLRKYKQKKSLYEYYITHFDEINNKSIFTKIEFINYGSWINYKKINLFSRIYFNLLLKLNYKIIIIEKKKN